MLQANLTTTVSLVSAFLLFLYSLRQSRKSTLPPGPRRWPLVGNLFQLPRTNPWLTYGEWAKIYGDLFYIEVFGQPTIMINKISIAKEILEKHSLISSNRPHLVMAGELIGFNESFAMQQYGEEWRQQRKLMAQEFTSMAIQKYHPIQEKQIRLLVQNLVKDPSTFVQELQLRTGNIIFQVTYGYYVESIEDRMYQMSRTAMEAFAHAAMPGNFLVNWFPRLKHIPSWFPGAGFKKYAAECRENRLLGIWEPYHWSKTALENGKALLPNLCSTVISQVHGKLSHELERRLALAASTVQGGGQNTIIAAARAFFLTMLQYPEVQQKARAEIDAVVGSDRLPKISDKASLPYIRSLLTEVLRLHPPSPFGASHALSEDYTYEGFHLPKGCILMTNTWGMLHDPEIHENPMAFVPERYKNSDAEMKKITDLVFGFGRRTCPGSSFAEDSLYATIMTVLSTCEILPPLDKSGNPVIPGMTFVPGATFSPAGPFGIRLKYHSQNAMETLAESLTIAE